jgi:predicted NBD/HSP70 family sugar kinase
MKSNVELRQKNMLALLQAVRECGPIQKRQLQTVTGLSWGTVSTMTADLMDRGYLQILGKQSTEAGRRPDMLDISNQDHLAIGVDFHATGVIAVITDMRGRILRSMTAQFPEPNRTSALETLFEVLDQMVEACQGKHVLGVAFALQGVVDVNRGTSLRITRLEEWENVPLKELVEQKYQLPTLVIHDPDCLMKTEQVLGTTGMRGAVHALLLRMERYGIGMSILIGGERYIGTKGKAGEIGKTYVTHPGTGETMILEHCVCEKNVLDHYRRISGKECASVKILAELARQGDDDARMAFRWMGRCLGMALVNVINLFNPELITLAGHMSQYADLFEEEMNDAIGRDAYDDSAVIKTANLDSNASAQGAALLVVDQYLMNAVL